jgi:hypothetical protein
MRQFHCGNVQSIPWNWFSTSIIFPFPLFTPGFSSSVWWVSLCCLHMNIHRVLRSSSPLSVFSSPPPPLLLIPTPRHPSFTFMSPYHHLDLGSANEWEHAILGFMNFAHLTQQDDLQFHPLSCKWHNFTFLYGLVIFHGFYTHTHTLFIYSSVVGHLDRALLSENYGE